MISDFKKRSKTTIYKFLAKMGRNPRVYSVRYSPFNFEHALNYVYVYATRTEVVIVSIDHFDRAVLEYSDDDPDDDYPAVYTDKFGRVRMSPVWRLKLSAEEFVRQLEEAGVTVPRVWCVLLTRNRLADYRTMQPLWEQMGVTVYQDVKGMHKGRPLPVTPDSQLAGGRYFCVYDAEKTKVSLADIDMLEDDEYSSERVGDEKDDSEWRKEFQDLMTYFVNNEKKDDDGTQTSEGSEQSSNPSNGEDGVEEEDDEESEMDLERMIESISDDDDDDDDDEPDEHRTSVLPGVPEGLRVELLPPILDAQKELRRLVGCQNIKKRIEELVSLTLYNNMMLQMNPNGKRHNLSLHSVFFGRPGTGKTTVCKIMGALLKEAGVLSRGHVVVCNRSTFIGNLWGDEEKRINEVMDLAKGGVLMIDEAYLLNSSNPQDPGKLILPMLMDMLANERQRDIAVVICGYKEPMLRLLELNPGLDSRFPNRFEFEDFTLNQLLEITLQRVSEFEYHFTPAAWDKYKDLLDKAFKQRDPDTWGNARFVANQLERIYTRHAQRCVKQKHINKAQLLRLTPADIQPIDVPSTRRAIGF